jgi:hypothetical protein
MVFIAAPAPLFSGYFHSLLLLLGVSEAAPSAAHEPVRGALQLQVTPPGRTRSQVSACGHMYMPRPIKSARYQSPKFVFCSGLDTKSR